MATLEKPKKDWLRGRYRLIELRFSASKSSGRLTNAAAAWVYVTHCRFRLCISGHCASSRSTVTSKN
jgi:hypothetical protein